MTNDPVDLEAQNEAKARKDEFEKLERQIEISDFKWLMGHKQGRRFIWKLLEQYGVFRSSFRDEALEMAFLEGQRNNGLALLLLIHEHTPERYAELLDERKNAKRSSSTSSSGTSGSSPGSSSSASSIDASGSSPGSNDTRN